MSAPSIAPYLGPGTTTLKQAFHFVEDRIADVVPLA